MSWVECVGSVPWNLSVLHMLQLSERQSRLGSVLERSLLSLSPWPQTPHLNMQKYMYWSKCGIKEVWSHSKPVLKQLCSFVLSHSFHWPTLKNHLSCPSYLCPQDLGNCWVSSLCLSGKLKPWSSPHRWWQPSSWWPFVSCWPVGLWGLKGNKGLWGQTLIWSSTPLLSFLGSKSKSLKADSLRESKKKSCLVNTFLKKSTF